MQDAYDTIIVHMYLICRLSIQQVFSIHKKYSEIKRHLLIAEPLTIDIIFQQHNK